MDHARVKLLVASCLARFLGRLAEAVGLDLLIHPMRQRAGIQRGEQMVVLIVARIIADQPVQLLAVGVGGQAVARAGDAGKGCGQTPGLLVICMQRGNGIGI